VRDSDFNTLLIVDVGKGPTKISYGPDDALSRFAPQGPTDPQLLVSVNNSNWIRPVPVCDVDQMAVDYRWNNLENIRVAKSVLGDVFIYGGLTAATIGAHNRNSDAQIAGLAAVLAGLLAKSGAHADTRYLELIPKSIFLVPLKLDDASDLKLQIEGDDTSRLLLPHVSPGTSTSPHTLYLRLLNDTPDPPAYLTRANPRFGNDHTGVRPQDYPYILGGHDCSTPTAAVLAAYQSAGFLNELTLADLIDLYRAENISIPDLNDPYPVDPKAARHILEGGSTLFTPLPDSLGFKHLFYDSHPAYKPHSDVVRNLRDQIRVQLKNRSETDKN
ncbi:MAG TPA: hypothetical protein VG711_06510, partial [Phycisphaerales bacterium]|nr:hypothetical protein [Phycisphaerales bacterium]